MGSPIRFTITLAPKPCTARPAQWRMVCLSKPGICDSGSESTRRQYGQVSHGYRWLPTRSPLRRIGYQKDSSGVDQPYACACSTQGTGCGGAVDDTDSQRYTVRDSFVGASGQQHYPEQSCWDFYSEYINSGAERCSTRKKLSNGGKIIAAIRLGITLMRRPGSTLRTAHAAMCSSQTH